MKHLLRAALGVIFGCFVISSASAANLYVEKISAPMNTVAPELRHALASHHFKVVMSLNILKRIQAHQDVLHIANFNQRKFSDVRVYVFCNPDFFSQLLNSHWHSAAVCPLNLTLFGKNGSTTIVYPKRAAYTRGTAANSVAVGIDNSVISALKSIPNN